EGGVSVDMADLAGNPLVADADFIRAMPLALQKAMNVMQPGQPLPIRTRLTVDVPEDRSNPTYVYWDGELGLKDVVVNAGVQMRNVTGRLGCRGSYQGGLQSLAGNIQLDQATLFGQPIRNIHSQILVNQKKPDHLDLPNLKARLFGGDVGG